MPTRIVGKCPVCEGDFKVHVADGQHGMVHHGYQRPGFGYIIGDCFAVGREPYELSCEATKDYQKMVQVRLLSNHERLEALSKRTPEFVDVTKDIACVIPKPLYHRDAMIQGVIRYHRDDVNEHKEYEDAVKASIHNIQYQIRMLEAEVERTQRLINDWVLKPVRTVEEVEAEKRAVVAARVEEKRQIRAAKKAEADAKKAAREEKAAQRLAAIEVWTNLIEACATSEVNSFEERRKAALDAIHELRKTKYRVRGFYELGIDDALVALKLATRNETNPSWVTYSIYFR
jgi:hypothetical protein